MFTLHNYFTRNWNGVRLSPTEADLLFVLFVNSDRYVPIMDIADHLWPDPDAAPETEELNIKQHVCSLRRKFGRDLISNNFNGGYKVSA